MANTYEILLKLRNQASVPARAADVDLKELKRTIQEIMGFGVIAPQFVFDTAQINTFRQQLETLRTVITGFNANNAPIRIEIDVQGSTQQVLELVQALRQLRDLQNNDGGSGGRGGASDFRRQLQEETLALERLRAGLNEGSISAQQYRQQMQELRQRLEEMRNSTDASVTELTALERMLRRLDADLLNTNNGTRRWSGTISDLSSRLSGMQNIFVGVQAAIAGVIASQTGAWLLDAAKQASNAQIQFDLFGKALAKNNIELPQAEQMVKRLADTYKVMPSVVQDSTTQLLRDGYNLQQIEGILRSGASSALAFGSSAKQGFESVTSAVVTGSSALLNNIGIAQNLGDAYKQYAQELGKSTGQLTELEKKQAYANLLMKATQDEVQSTGTLMSGLSGKTSELTTEYDKLRNVIGRDVIPIATQWISKLSEIAKGSTETYTQLGGLPSILGQVKVALIAVASGAATFFASMAVSKWIALAANVNIASISITASLTRIWTAFNALVSSNAVGILATLAATAATAAAAYQSATNQIIEDTTRAANAAFETHMATIRKFKEEGTLSGQLKANNLVRVGVQVNNEELQKASERVQNIKKELAELPKNAPRGVLTSLNTELKQAEQALAKLEKTKLSPLASADDLRKAARYDNAVQNIAKSTNQATNTANAGKKSLAEIEQQIRKLITAQQGLTGTALEKNLNQVDALKTVYKAAGGELSGLNNKLQNYTAGLRTSGVVAHKADVKSAQMAYAEWKQTLDGMTVAQLQHQAALAKSANNAKQYSAVLAELKQRAKEAEKAVFESLGRLFDTIKNKQELNLINPSQTLAALERLKKQLESLMAKAVMGSDEWNKYASQLKTVNGEIANTKQRMLDTAQAVRDLIAEADGIRDSFDRNRDPVDKTTASVEAILQSLGDLNAYKADDLLSALQQMQSDGQITKEVFDDLAKSVKRAFTPVDYAMISDGQNSRFMTDAELRNQSFEGMGYTGNSEQAYTDLEALTEAVKSLDDAKLDLLRTQAEEADRFDELGVYTTELARRSVDAQDTVAAYQATLEELGIEGSKAIEGLDKAWQSYSESIAQPDAPISDAQNGDNVKDGIEEYTQALRAKTTVQLDAMLATEKELGYRVAIQQVLAEQEDANIAIADSYEELGIKGSEAILGLDRAVQSYTDTAEGLSDTLDLEELINGFYRLSDAEILALIQGESLKDAHDQNKQALEALNNEYARRIALQDDTNEKASEELRQLAEIDAANTRKYQLEKQLNAAKDESVKTYKKEIDEIDNLIIYYESLGEGYEKTIEKLSELKKGYSDLNNKDGIKAVEKAQKELNKALGESEAPYASNIEALQELKTKYPGIAVEVDKLIAKYKELSNTEISLRNMEKYASGIQKILGAVGSGLNNNFGKNLQGIAEAVGSAMSIAKDVATGNYVGAAVTGITQVFNWFTRYSNAANEAAQKNAEFQKSLSLIDASKFAKAYTQSRGFWGDLFNGPAVVTSVNEAAMNIAKSIEGGFMQGVGGGIQAFLQGTGDMLTNLQAGLKNALISGIQQAVVQGAVLKGALGDLLTKLTEGIAGGTDVSGIIDQITAKLPEVAAKLESVLSPIRDKLQTIGGGLIDPSKFMTGTKEVVTEVTETVKTELGKTAEVLGTGMVEAFGQNFGGMKSELEKNILEQRNRMNELLGLPLETLTTEVKKYVTTTVKTVNELALSIAMNLEAGFKGGISNGIKAFLDGTGNMLDNIRQGLRDAVIAGIVDATIKGAVVKGALGKLIEDFQNGIASGTDVSGVIAAIGAKLPEIAAMLESQLAPLKDVLDKTLPKLENGTTVEATLKGVYKLPDLPASYMAAPNWVGLMGGHVDRFGGYVDRLTGEGIRLTVDVPQENIRNKLQIGGDRVYQLQAALNR